MKGRFVLIAALLAVLFSAPSVRAQQTTKRVVPEVQAQQTPVKKLNLVITTASVHADAKTGVALAAEIVKQAKTFEDVNVSVNADGGFVPVDADQTLNLRLVAATDPDDATKTLFSLIVVVHEKGNVFSFYLGSGNFKVTSDVPVEDAALQILGYAQASFQEYVDSNNPAAQQ